MPHLFRNYTPFTVLILIITAFLMKLQALSTPVAPVALPDHIVFATILDFLNPVMRGSALAYTWLTVVLLLTQALYLNHLTVRHRMFARNTYFPAFSYLLLTSINPAFNYFSEPVLINWLVLIALNIMLTFNQTSHPRKQIFNAGFMICLPALFQFPALGFILLFFLALLLLRSVNGGEWAVGAMGILTPVYFFACILFLADSLEAIVRLPEFGFAFPTRVDHPVYFFGTLSGLVLLLAIGSVSIQQQFARITIYIRRSWYLIYIYLFISLGVAVIALSALNAEWLVAIPPLSFIIAQAFTLEKSKRFSNFTFYFSLVLLIFCQLALNK